MSKWIEYTQEDEQECGRAYYDYWYEEEMRDDDRWKEEEQNNRLFCPVSG